MPTNVGPFRAVLLGDPVAGTGVTAVTTSKAYDCAGAGKLTVYYTGTGTINAGTIIIEEADYPDDPQQTPPYSGLWSQIESRDPTTFSGVTIAIHLTIAAYAYVRVRISSTVMGGGGVIAVLRGQE